MLDDLHGTSGLMLPDLGGTVLTGQGAKTLMDLPRLILILLGISSVTTQLLTLREFLSIFHGNEITVSLAVFAWLLLTGVGAFMGRALKKISQGALAFFVLAAAMIPLMQIAAIRLLVELFFIHGASQGFYEIFLYIAVMVAPYCLLSGFLLPLSQAASRITGNYLESGALYVYDSIGDIAGGIIFSFLLVYVLSPFQALVLTSLPLAVTGLAILWFRRSHWMSVCLFVPAVSLYAAGLSPQVERWSLSRQYGKILEYEESPYGRIVLTAEGTQKSLWESGVPLYSSEDNVNAEEKVHYALAQIDGTEAVLLVSGGLGESLAEIRKHKPAIIHYVELDPLLTALGLRHGLIRGGPGITIINTDGRLHLKETRTRYDAVIFDLPEPDSFQINRFYTDECLKLVKGILRPGGVFSLSLDYSSNYLSRIERRKISILFRTLRDHFEHILIIPGERLFFLCSDSGLHEDIPARLAVKGVAAPYVEGFFYGNVTRDRMERIRASIDQGAPTNRDFKPTLMNATFQWWFKKYGVSPMVLLITLGVAALVYPMLIKRQEYLLYTTGFVMMGAEMVAVMSFQAVFGYLYLQIGAIVSAFLLGLFPGALAGASRWVKERASGMLLYSEFFIMVLLIFLLAWIGLLGTLPSPWFFLSYCVVLSSACGFQFPVATHVIGEARSPVAGCLAADLWGAACGTIAAGALLIPFMGMELTLIGLIAVKASSIITSYVGWRGKDP